MKIWKTHSKVWLVWCSWLAIQYVSNEWWNLGIHIEPRRPLVDIFIGPLTIAFGRHPVLTDPRYAHRHSCRGFIIGNIEDAVF